MHEVKGANGRMSFNGHFITIEPRGGIIAHFTGKAPQRIPLKSVEMIELVKPSFMKSGYIRVCTAGMAPLIGSPGRPAFMDARSDPNALIFSRDQFQAFSAIRDEIEEALVGT